FNLCAIEDSILPAPGFQQKMVPESPPGSDILSNSFEYSPSSQEFPYVQENSNSYQDPRSCAFANVESYNQHHNNTAFCYCAYCDSMEYHDAMTALEQYSYPNSNFLEYFPSSTVSEEFFERELNTYDLLQLR
ncbi:hypothetical protein GDO86_012755, partial [Hymenochirus boettgeri]